MKQREPLLFYLLAILLLALSSSMAYLLAYTGIEQRENDALIVNLAGRQRMLSQRMAKDCLKLQYTRPTAADKLLVLNNLRSSAEELDIAYLKLHGNIPVNNFTITNSVQTQALFGQIENSYRTIKSAVAQILEKHTGQDSLIDLILTNEPIFLAGMDKIVWQYQQESAQNIRQLGRLEKATLMFTFMLLLLELFFIFIPLNRRIQRILRAQEMQNQLLIEKQSALEKSTELMQKMQQSLLEVEKLATLGEAVGVITHEINTPVGIAVTAASSLDEYTKQFAAQYKQDRLRKSELEAYLSHAEEGSALILSNLEKSARLLKDFKHVAIPQLSRQKELFDLSGLLRQVVNTLTPLIKNTDLQLQMRLPEKLEIHSYPGFFAQILMNLVTNSLHHAYPGTLKRGTIEVALSREGDSLIWHYQDDGVGIPANMLPHIFEPFFSTHKQQGGTGLGLSITQNLVVGQLQGTITCANKVAGGVIFEITVPLN